MGRPASTRTRSTGTRKKKRRTRSPHPGVVLIPPDAAGRHPTWRARYVDADTGRQKKVRLDPAGLPTAETRRDWAIRRSKALARRRMELESGAPRATGTTMADAVAQYFKAHPELRPRTLSTYRVAADKLIRWASRAGVRTADDLTRAKLMDFRAHLVAERKRVAAPGSKRGTSKASTEPRSAHTVNRELRSARTILGHLRKRDLLPRLTSDDLRDALERMAVTTERVDYLKPADLRRLLQAALRHDADTHQITREEHKGLRPVGTTPKYDAVAPFVACVLLTGMRLGEAVSLEWKQVDLDALDHDGNPVGEIHLTGATKTKRARTIDLDVSPALRRLLAALKLATGGKGRVFGHLTEGTVNAARKRLQADYGAPDGFGWQALRRTCGTYLTNAPGIFGAASAYRSARQLGHSVQVAERHYLGLARGIPREARDLETAMQVADLMREIVKRQGAGQPKRKAVAK
jgi:integrase